MEEGVEEEDSKLVKEIERGMEVISWLKKKEKKIGNKEIDNKKGIKKKKV